MVQMLNLSGAFMRPINLKQWINGNLYGKVYKKRKKDVDKAPANAIKLQSAALNRTPVKTKLSGFM